MPDASSTRRDIVPLAVLSVLAILCAGCKSCGRTDPEVLDRSLADGAPAETAVVVPAPPATESSTPFDPRPPAVAPTIEELNDQAHAAGLLVEVYFDFDRADLSAEARAALEHNARYLRQAADVRLLIEGHCDERGTHEYNLALGQLRASATREFLIRLGVDSDRLGTISYGEHEGVCFASNEDCWGRNRRAYFRIAGRITDLPPSDSRRRAGS